MLPAKQLNIMDTPSGMYHTYHNHSATLGRGISSLGVLRLSFLYLRHVKHLVLEEDRVAEMTQQGIFCLKSSNKASNTQDGPKVSIHLLKSSQLQTQL